MSLLPFFEWCEQSGVGSAIRDSIWLFPVIEAFHLVGLAVLGGAVLIVNLRLLGLVLPGYSVAQLSREALPWMSRSLAVMILSGVPLFLSEAIKCYYSTPFWLKMYSLAAAIVFSYTVWRYVASNDARGNGAAAKLTAIVSIALWAIVGWGGRWIGFS